MDDTTEIYHGSIRFRTECVRAGSASASSLPAWFHTVLLSCVPFGYKACREHLTSCGALITCLDSTPTVAVMSTLFDSRNLVYEAVGDAVLVHPESVERLFDQGGVFVCFDEVFFVPGPVLPEHLPDDHFTCDGTDLAHEMPVELSEAMRQMECQLFLSDGQKGTLSDTDTHLNYATPSPAIRDAILRFKSSDVCEQIVGKVAPNQTSHVTVSGVLVFVLCLVLFGVVMYGVVWLLFGLLFGW